MYNIGICDDGENICASVENMLLKYAEKKAVQVDVQVWYTGEKLRDYLARDLDRKQCNQMRIYPTV